MKYTLIILSMLVPFFAQAGGGGGLRPGMEMMSLNRQIVFNMDERDGAIRFAVGKLVNNQWQVQKLEVSTSALIEQHDIFSALQESKDKGDWAQIR